MSALNTLRARRIDTPSRWGPVLGLLVSLPAFAVVATAASEPARPEPPANTAATAPAATTAESPAAESQAGLATAKPPDGKWLKDDKGREYFLERVDKKDNLWMRMGERQVRFRFGDFEIDSEDANAFWIRFYRVDEPPAQPEPASKTGAASTVEPKPPALRTPPAEERLEFQPYSAGLPQKGQWRDGFVLADMNEDGRLDVVSGPARKSGGRPVIFLGDGQGTWRVWSEAHYPPLPYDYGDIAVADFDGDGHLDLAVACHLRGLLLLRGDGKGTFGRWGTGLDFAVPGPNQQPGGFSTRALVAADWDQDGHPDLVAVGEGPMLNVSRPDQGGGLEDGATGSAVFVNKGDGTWQKLRGRPEPSLWGNHIAVADLDGDGRLDFVTSVLELGSKRILNYGTSDGLWRTEKLEQLQDAPLVTAVQIADFDVDGHPDLVVGYLVRTESESGWQTLVDVFFARPAGTWSRLNLITAEGRDGVFAVAVGDFEGDHVPDVAAATGHGDLWVVLRHAGGAMSFQPVKAQLEQNVNCRGYHLEAADLNGDGRNELIAEFAGETSAMFAPLDCPSGGRLAAWSPKPIVAAP